MSAPNGEATLEAGCGFSPHLEGFWASDAWQLRKGDRLPDLALVRDGGGLDWDGLAPSLGAELKWACMRKFTSGDWKLTHWGSRVGALRTIVGWFADEAPNVTCVLERDPAHWAVSLQKHLLARGRYRPQPGRYMRRGDGTGETVACVNNDPVVSTFKMLYVLLDQAHDQRELFLKDTWSARELGIHTDRGTGPRRVIFQGISQPWLKDAAKRVVQLRLSSYSIADSEALAALVKDFSRYLDRVHPGMTGSAIDRTVVLGFLHALREQGLSAGGRGGKTTYLRVFLETCGREGWGGIVDRPLVYRDDYPRPGASIPRYLPADVLAQLQAHLHELPDPMRRMTRILAECGMRISELCTAPIDCLLRDDDGDYFLRYYQGKQRKEDVVPISREVAAVVQEQQAAARTQQGSAARWLFPGRTGRPVVRQTLPQALNRLAAACGIVGPDGRRVWFAAHQFRHTVGTSLINNGVPQHLVQRFLGHESPEMTNTYAHIFDVTLKQALEDYRTRKVDVTGTLVESFGDAVPADALLLKRTVLAQALPNGHCHLPIQVGPCPHANACLTCTHFRSSERFLPVLRQQLAETERIIQWAQDNGATRQFEMNQRVRTNLLKMITALEGGANLTEIGELLQDGGEMQMHTQTPRRPQDAKP
jgi:integrase/recombinase XerD